MAWLADQKSMGKFYGALAGGFVALTWGHWHHRIMAHFNVNCSKVYTQLVFLGVFVLPARPRSGLEITSPAPSVMELTSTSPTGSTSTTTSSSTICAPLCTHGLS